VPARTNTAPSVDGEFRFDEPVRAAAADDFGHIVGRTPESVLRPASDQDLATTIRWAAERGHSLAPRGQGHSVFGRAQAPGGIVIDMRSLRAVHTVQSDRVVVDAGATWSEVLAATLPRGLAPPALPDYLGLSVGGTLAVGGVGAAISQFGLASDNVLDMEVVTGRGAKVACSPTAHADLFDAARAGLGQVGVITRTTLKLLPAPQQVRRFLLFYPDLQTMLHDARRLAGDDRFDVVQGAVLAAPAGGWAFRLDAVKEFSGNPPDDNALLIGLSDDRSLAQPSTMPYLDYLARLATLEAALRANGQWFFPHPWLTTFIGDSAVEPVVGGELAELTPADLGPFGQVVLSPVRRRPVTSPLLPLPPDELCFAFNLVRIPAAETLAEAERLVAANRAIYDRVRAAGGTLYPVSAFPMSPDDWRAHFGSAFPQFSEAKQAYDPSTVLTPGYEIFS
jgi:cytokinin dehydrogenase